MISHEKSVANKSGAAGSSGLVRWLSVFLLALPLFLAALPSPAIAQDFGANELLNNNCPNLMYGDEIVCNIKATLEETLQYSNFNMIRRQMVDILWVLAAWQLLVILFQAKDNFESTLPRVVGLFGRCVLGMVILTPDKYGLPTEETIAHKVYMGIERAGVAMITKNVTSLGNGDMKTIMTVLDLVEKEISPDEDDRFVMAEDGNPVACEEDGDPWNRIFQPNASNIPTAAQFNCLKEVIGTQVYLGNQGAENLTKIRRYMEGKVDGAGGGVGGLTMSEIKETDASRYFRGAPVTAGIRISLLETQERYRVALRYLAAAEKLLAKYPDDTLGTNGLLRSISYLTQSTTITASESFSGTKVILTLGRLASRLSMLVLKLSVFGCFVLSVIVPVLLVPMGLMIWEWAWVLAPLEGKIPTIFASYRKTFIPFALTPTAFSILLMLIAALLKTLPNIVANMPGTFGAPLIFIVFNASVLFMTIVSWALLSNSRNFAAKFMDGVVDPLVDSFMNITNVFGWLKNLMTGAVALASGGLMAAAALGPKSLGLAAGLGGRAAGAAGSALMGLGGRMGSPTLRGGGSLLARTSTGLNSSANRLWSMGSRPFPSRPMAPFGGQGASMDEAGFSDAAAPAAALAPSPAHAPAAASSPAPVAGDSPVGAEASMGLLGNMDATLRRMSESKSGTTSLGLEFDVADAEKRLAARREAAVDKFNSRIDRGLGASGRRMDDFDDLRKYAEELDRELKSLRDKRSGAPKDFSEQDRARERALTTDREYLFGSSKIGSHGAGPMASIIRAETDLARKRDVAATAKEREAGAIKEAFKGAFRDIIPEIQKLMGGLPASAGTSTEARGERRGDRHGTGRGDGLPPPAPLDHDRVHRIHDEHVRKLRDHHAKRPASRLERVRRHARERTLASLRQGIYRGMDSAVAPGVSGHLDATGVAVKNTLSSQSAAHREHAERHQDLVRQYHAELEKHGVKRVEQRAQDFDQALSNTLGALNSLASVITRSIRKPIEEGAGKLGFATWGKKATPHESQVSQGVEGEPSGDAEMAVDNINEDTNNTTMSHDAK